MLQVIRLQFVWRRLAQLQIRARTTVAEGGRLDRIVRRVDGVLVEGLQLIRPVPVDRRLQFVMVALLHDVLHGHPLGHLLVVRRLHLAVAQLLLLELVRLKLFLSANSMNHLLSMPFLRLVLVTQHLFICFYIFRYFNSAN